MEQEKPRVLVVSRAHDSALVALLADQYVEVASARNATEATLRFRERFFDIVIAEVDAANLVDSAAYWRRESSNAVVILFGNADETASSILARQAGAFDYLAWPIDAERLRLALKGAVASSDERDDRALEAPDLGLIGASPQIVALRETISRVAAGDATVFVRGENGTGKEVVARAIHGRSPRRSAPFIKVHAPALPDALLESELFGYEKGAFTGATARKPGRVELAEHGTLFLDEVAELSLPMQAKLLRLVQDREFERLGGTRTVTANVRFITATHRDVEHMLESQAFREDLFYRLNVVTLWLPPLRARRGDIPLILEHYLARFRVSSRRPALAFDDEAVKTLVARRWPGNVRQLINFVERMVVLCPGDVITASDVLRELDEQTAFLTQSTKGDPSQLGAAGRAAALPAPARTAPSAPSAIRPLHEDLRRAERHALEKALRGARNNRALAARLLGVSRRTLYTKLEEHGLL